MATRSIHIPPNPSASRGRRLPVAVTVDEDEPSPLFATATSAVQARATRAQPVHRYSVGERVRMGGGGNTITRQAAACKIIALLPYEGRGLLQYRVKSDAEQFERIVTEADLTRS